MTQLSEHFTLKEGTDSAKAKELGIDNQPSTLQLENMKHAAKGMEEVRALLGKPIKINSWLRLPAVNVAVGGSEKSAHMDGWAIDFRCDSFGTPLEIAKAIVAAGIKFDQIIHEYGSWVHISFEPALRCQQLTVMRPVRKPMYLSGLLTAEEYANYKV